MKRVPRIHLIVAGKVCRAGYCPGGVCLLVCQNNVTESIGCRACKMRKETWGNEPRTGTLVWPLSIDWPERKCEKTNFHTPNANAAWKITGPANLPGPRSSASVVLPLLSAILWLASGREKVTRNFDHEGKKAEKKN